MIARRTLLTAAVLSGLREAGAASPERWRIVTEYPATSIPGEGIGVFADLATRLSDGALTVTPAYDAPGGVRSATMLETVADGRVEAADAFTGALGWASPIFELSALPFLTRSMDDAARLLVAARPDYEAALGARGLVLLYASPWPPSGLWSRGALDGPDALRGLRVRTYDGASTAVLAGAGATPVQISFADAVPRLRAGELDAVLSSGDGGAGARLWELLPHFTKLDYAFPLSLAFCRAPAGPAVREAGRQTEVRQFAAMATRVAENEARMRQQGVVVALAPTVRAALEVAAAPVVAQWTERAGPEGRAVLEAYRRG